MLHSTPFNRKDFMTPLFFRRIGLTAGALSGICGLGGGSFSVPALMYGMGFPQKTATGTSLSIFLVPVGIAAVTQYYRAGHVDLRAALLIAPAMLLGSWFSAKFALQLDPKTLKSLFSIFLLVLGTYLLIDARFL